MKFLILIFILMFQNAQANEYCGVFFEEASTSYYAKIGEASEGAVYLDVTSGIAKKVFHSKQKFDNAMVLQHVLSSVLKEAGFHVPEIKKTDDKNSTLFREFIEGDTIDQFLIDSMGTSKGRKEWQRLEDSYIVLFNRAHDLLSQNKFFKFERYRSHIPVISGTIAYQGKIYNVRIHAQNIIVRFNGKKPEFYIIDFS